MLDMDNSYCYHTLNKSLSTKLRLVHDTTRRSLLHRKSMHSDGQIAKEAYGLGGQNTNRSRLSEGSSWTLPVEDTNALLHDGANGHLVECTNEFLAGDTTLASLDEADRTLDSSVEDRYTDKKLERHETRCAHKDTVRSHHSSAPVFSSYMSFSVTGWDEQERFRMEGRLQEDEH